MKCDNNEGMSKHTAQVCLLLASSGLAGKQQLAVGALRVAPGCGTGEKARSVSLASSQRYFFLPFFLLFVSFPTPKHGNVVIAV